MSQPMFTLCGQVANVYMQPPGVSKKTGEAYEGRDKVQILGDIPQQDGSKRLDLITLTVDDASLFKVAQGKQVRVAVGFFATGKGAVTFYIPKGAKPAIIGLQA